MFVSVIPFVLLFTAVYAWNCRWIGELLTERQCSQDDGQFSRVVAGKGLYGTCHLIV